MKSKIDFNSMNMYSLLENIDFFIYLKNKSLTL
jgi:hypothetical protein